ncbi:uncharacterized protein [Cardiocondyla obscurior]|uniref:uncharacterized protein n=1 Tax=Cardiocondyla obscurior TaxID=286306 RepID=UPI0039658B6D
MRFIQQAPPIKVVNFDDKLLSECVLRRHGNMLPSSIRAIICGPSNCGKTNVLISLLESPHGVQFENVYVYSKSLQQPKYQYLKKILAPIEENNYFTFSNNIDVVPPSKALPNSIFIFDDIACDKQDVDGTNMKHIYNDHVNTDMSFEDFGKLCRICWQQKYGFVSLSIHRLITVKLDMNNSSELKNREIIVKKIAQTSDSIRKKYHAIKTGKMEEDIALERHFKPIIEPLKQIVENTVGHSEVESTTSKNESYFPGKKDVLTPKQKRLITVSPISLPEEKEESRSTPKQNRLINTSLISLLGEEKDESRFTPKRKRLSTTSSITASTPIKSIPIKSALKRSHTIPERSHSHSIEDVFDTADEPLVTSIRQKLQTSESLKTLQTHYGPLGQKYLGAVLSGKKSINIDSVYGVYFNDNGTMICNKRVDLDKNDNILIDGKKYPGTVGLYELIFMRFPDESSYTETDKENYKSILMATNAHKRDYNSQNQVKSNKGHKYMNIIALVLSKKIGQGIPYAVTLNNNKIDYVHWDDPNELVDRLRLLEASRYAGHNAHDNEIFSIIEELCEVWLIIN